MRKRPYRSVRVNNLDLEQLRESVADRAVVVGVDVAKKDFVLAVMDRQEQRVRSTIRWDHPRQSSELVALLGELKHSTASLEIAMEPSGVYGDAVRFALHEAGLPVFRVSPKRSHDAKEVYDGVPSLHDPKSAAIIAKLHLDGMSEPWPIKSDRERTLKAALWKLEIHEKQYQQNKNRIEALLARHWPELTQHLDLGSATLIETLASYGSPQAVAADIEGARKHMRATGGHFLDPDKIECVLESASMTIGLPPVPEELELVMHVATEARRNQKEALKARRSVEKLSAASGATKQLAPVVGKTTAAVIVAGLGDPRAFSSATALIKSAGLNLKEKSSGKQRGALRITKRGPGVVRLFLWMAALRLIQSDPIVRAWYAKKVKRDGGRSKSKAVVAVMRKLLLALWHVARGEPFDASKLFDVSRLDVRVAASEIRAA